MSYEGYTQNVCRAGHYFCLEAQYVFCDDNIQTCSVAGCGEPVIFTHNVDITNGCEDRGDGYCTCGFIPLDQFPLKVPDKLCESCRHVVEHAKYEPPTNLNSHSV